MIIYKNTNAMNAHRHLGMHQLKLTQAQERLSSGLRINRAGDDAAGLAISEKMRAQVRGLNQASRNTQDGISLLQTAEGSLNETHNILQRMRELAVQASNDTNTASDRQVIQKEIDELTKEVSRIANTTEFNRKQLLDGSANLKFQVGANAGQNISISINAMDAVSLNIGRLEAGRMNGVVSEVIATTNTHVARLIVDPSNPEHDIVGRFDSNGLSGPGYYVGDVLYYGTSEPEEASSYWIDWGGHMREVVLHEETDSTSTNTMEFRGTKGNLYQANWQSNEVHGVAGYYMDDTLIVEADEPFNHGQVVSIHANVIDPTVGPTLTGVNVLTVNGANEALSVIDTAIALVSAERSKIGATQNRMEYALSTITHSSENIQTSESLIRDADMAKEMMAFTKQNLLAQVAQSMLAQANQQPQQVLRLLS